MVAFLATQRLGALWVGIAKPLAAPEKRYLLEDSGASVYLVPPELALEARDIAPPSLREVIGVDVLARDALHIGRGDGLDALLELGPVVLRQPVHIDLVYHPADSSQRRKASRQALDERRMRGRHRREGELAR